MSNSRVIYGQELTIDPVKHAYMWGADYVPGVTSILKIIDKPALIQWSANMASDHFLAQVKAGRDDFAAIHKESKVAHRKKSDAAKDIGHEVHAYVEAHFKNLPLPELTSDEAKRGVEAFHSWLAAHKVEVLASERLCFSKEHYYAGTCDFVAKIDGAMAVGDVKTSSGIFSEYRLQTAAYQHALQEEKGMRFDVRWIVRFDKKTGKFEAKPFYEFELDFKGFLAALTLHRTMQAIAG